MCRFMIYKGVSVVVAELVTSPDHSIIKQSYGAKERTIPLNGDGFGLGWYIDSRDLEPGLFTSLTPAWANLNLRRLSKKITSECVFAHVRAATPGFAVSETNCHPFKYKNLLWMHNGAISRFSKIKRKLRASLSDTHYDMIQGTTDSEHAFALFLEFLAKDAYKAGLEDMERAMTATIRQLNLWLKEEGVEGPSTMNFAVTNGKEVAVTRYVSHADHNPETLYCSVGSQFECKDGVCTMRGFGNSRGSVIISSEPLTEHSGQWDRVESGTLILVGTDNTITQRKFEA